MKEAEKLVRGELKKTIEIYKFLRLCFWAVYGVVIIMLIMVAISPDYDKPTTTQQCVDEIAPMTYGNYLKSNYTGLSYDCRTYMESHDSYRTNILSMAAFLLMGFALTLVISVFKEYALIKQMRLEHALEIDKLKQGKKGRK